MKAKRTGIIIRPDAQRVLFRPFNFPDARTEKIIARINTLTEAQVQENLAQVMLEFGSRHQKAENFFLKRFAQIKRFLLTDAPVSRPRQLLLGAYFTMEYSLESAALFNPSMVWHPDQTNLPAGSKRFIISLRATGEGHISSITFRSGVIDEQNEITLDRTTRFVSSPEISLDQTYERDVFEKKLVELGLQHAIQERIMAGLDDTFTFEKLQQQIKRVLRQQPNHREYESIASGITTLARSNYELVYSPEQHLSERIIFPHSPNETNGIEDARFVQFREDDGETTYYATYTAYNGRFIYPQLLETKDFITFKINTLNGSEVQNKGMALFPRKINGYYAMIGRQDGENLYLMYSDMVHFWHTKEILLKPTFPWEYVQLGNCGSPIDTKAGWLVLSHGVGPMRKYSIGAFLLDLNDPSKVIGRSEEPLLSADDNEREGYVPNVVYSCGGQIHGNQLIIPYAMSDYASSFAMVNVDELLEYLVATGKNL